MSCFHNLLVGVDLTKTNVSESAALEPVAASSIRHAQWVARASRASLTFFSVLPQPGTAAEAASRILGQLVGEAQKQGIEAEALTAVGQSWIEIIRQVLRGQHDLLIVGTHDPHGLRRLVLGSTAQAAPRMPVPSVGQQTRTGRRPRNILVASDLSPLSETAVRVGLGIGHLAEAHTHLLDVVEYPLDRVWIPYPTDPLTRQYHSRVRAEADQALHAQVEKSGCHVTDPLVTVHVADGDGIPDHAIVQFIHDQQIDLLVLGTAARHGLSGIVLGNTAERLLPEVPCSVLAVKPAAFRCVVPADGG